MYTEEEEFDYNEYLNEDDDNNSRKPFLDKGVIIKILIIIGILLVLIFAVFLIKNKLVNKEEKPKEETPIDDNRVFNNNLAILQNAGIEYFFKDDHKPKEVGETVKVSVAELKENGYITDIFDYNGLVCGYTSSYVSMTRNKNDYLLEIYLSCEQQEDTVKYYYNLDYECLTCNGEEYEPDNSTDDATPDENVHDGTDSTLACSFGGWTTEYKADQSLERETRVLVKGYKEEITYGEYGIKSETPIESNDKIDVKVEAGTKQVSTLTDWVTTTTKPENKLGRKIETYTEKVPYTYKESHKEKYTVTQKSWDNNALYCETKGRLNVVCTYEKTVWETKTGYNTKTYYKYQDTIITTINTTYYSSRPKYINVVYTDYVLESELPSGYTKVPGSERIEYRYKDVCGK